MRPVVITISGGAGVSAAVPLDRYLTPFQVSVSCVVVGTVSYKLQYTFDDVFSVAAGSINWLDDTDIPAGTVANAQTFITSPVSAVRINQASGTGSITATINQAGAR